MDIASTTRMLGLAAGAALAPLLAFGSAVRRARVFHPRGTVLWGRVIAADVSPPWRELGVRLEGSVLVRFSGAWWKQRQWLDVLGCALRFTRASLPSVDPMIGDQDLLLATVRIPMTTAFAPLSTHVDDYLRNTFFGVSPFVAAPLGRIKLRLSADHPAPPTDSRAHSLDAALALGPIRLRLEARDARAWSDYRTIALIELTERVTLDQEALTFDPYRTGRALSPAGFVHSMRIPVYAASRKARSLANAK